MVPAFVLKERHKEGKLEKKNERKKERRMEGMKRNEGKNGGNYFIIECKMLLWHMWTHFLRLLGGWGGGWLFNCSSWYLYLMQYSVIIPANTESNVNYSLFQKLLCLCLFTLLYFMTFVNLSRSSKAATIFSSRKKISISFTCYWLRSKTCSLDAAFSGLIITNL